MPCPNGCATGITNVVIARLPTHVFAQEQSDMLRDRTAVTAVQRDELIDDTVRFTLTVDNQPYETPNFFESRYDFQRKNRTAVEDIDDGTVLITAEPPFGTHTPQCPACNTVFSDSIDWGPFDEVFTIDDDYTPLV